MTAIVVLLLAVAGEGVVYWIGPPPVDVLNDPATLVNEKVRDRQAESLFGKESLFLQKWSDDLKQPGTRALIILGTAALIAGGCFYFARLLDRADERSGGTDSPGG
jgi:hypothetical protein